MEEGAWIPTVHGVRLDPPAPYLLEAEKWLMRKILRTS